MSKNKTLEKIRNLTPVNILEPDHTCTLTVVLNNGSLSPSGSFFNIPFFMSTAGYGVFVNQVLPMTFFVGIRVTP